MPEKDVLYYEHQLQSDIDNQRINTENKKSVDPRADLRNSMLRQDKDLKE